jgi:hypothetical protein
VLPAGLQKLRRTRGPISSAFWISGAPEFSLKRYAFARTFLVVFCVKGGLFMMGYSISPLELCRIIEEAFLPTRCVCTSVDGTSLKIQLFTANRERGHEQGGFSVVGIPVAGLNNSRAIARLVRELREEFALGTHMFPGQMPWVQTGR